MSRKTSSIAIVGATLFTLSLLPLAFAQRTGTNGNAAGTGANNGTGFRQATPRNAATPQNNAANTNVNAANNANNANNTNTNNPNANNTNANTNPNNVNPNNVNPNTNLNNTAVTPPDLLNGANSNLAGAASQNFLNGVQNLAANRPVVSFHGQLMDINSFFLGNAATSGNPALQGQAISNATNTNGNAATANNTNGANTGTSLDNAGPGHVNLNQAAAAVNSGATNVNLSPANANTGTNAANTNLANTNANTNANAAANTASAFNNFSTNSFGQLMVLQTSNSSILAVQDPTAGSNALAASGANSLIRGRIVERNGIRLLLVSSVDAGNTIGTNTNTANTNNRKMNTNTNNNTNRNTNNTAR